MNGHERVCDPPFRGTTGVQHVAARKIKGYRKLAARGCHRSHLQAFAMNTATCSEAQIRTGFTPRRETVPTRGYVVILNGVFAASVRLTQFSTHRVEILGKSPPVVETMR